MKAEILPWPVLFGHSLLSRFVDVLIEGKISHMLGLMHRPPVMANLPQICRPECGVGAIYHERSGHQHDQNEKGLHNPRRILHVSLDKHTR